MKAIVCTKYGLPEVLQLKEVEMPVPKDDEVLIKVHAASVNSWDLDLRTDKPYLTRLGGGKTKVQNTQGRHSGAGIRSRPKRKPIPAGQ